MNFPKVKHPTPTPCRCCHQLTPTTKVYRLVGVGPRPLCSPCHANLEAMGYDIKAVA